MTSLDGLHRHKESDNRQNSYTDEFLEYYHKHRPAGSVPAGYNFKPFCISVDNGRFLTYNTVAILALTDVNNTPSSEQQVH